jgi:hypothetical protein
MIANENNRSCSLTDFMKVLEPWLSADYIRKVSVYENRIFKILFMDGVIDTYNIDDCTRPQFQNIIDKLEAKGIPLER